MVDFPDDEDDLEEGSSETEEDEPQAPVTEVEGRTIREVMAAQAEDELHEARRAEFVRQKQEQDKRVEARRVKQRHEATTERRQRVVLAMDVRRRVQVDLTTAARALSRASRHAAATDLPRFSDEGLEHQKLRRALGEALGAVRRAGRVAGRSFDEGFDEAPEIEEEVEEAFEPEAV